MDAAKVAAFMCGDTEQSLDQVYGVELTRGTRLPLIQASGGWLMLMMITRWRHCAGTDNLRDGE